MPASAIMPMNAGPEKKTGFLNPPMLCWPILIQQPEPGHHADHHERDGPHDGQRQPVGAGLVHQDDVDGDQSGQHRERKIAEQVDGDVHLAFVPPVERSCRSGTGPRDAAALAKHGSLIQRTGLRLHIDETPLAVPGPGRP